MKTAFIVDSTAGINEQLKAHPDVYEVILTVQFADGEIFKDTTDEESVIAFYEKLQQESTLPKTAQPSPGEYYQLIEHLVEQGYDSVIAIHLSSKLSGTYQTANMILQEYQGKLKTACIDSKGTSVVIENMLEQALHFYEAAELSFDEIVRQLEWLARESHIYMMIEDLNNLVKGGRLSAANAFLGGLLQIKPLLEFTETGEVALFEKIRTEKRVYRRWADLIQAALEKYPKGIHVRFGHSNALEAAKTAQKMMQELFPQVISFSIGYLTPVVGVHGGSGVQGMAIIPIADGIEKE
ncbi:DegV family protein [Aerococcaceae bacterium zg-ZJ1578]|uniref:DegV family protein n=1 Tax=Aerococcaceae bacterium zg-252 TaxID=2796928 RepID=UPI001A1CF2FA|nr:DegV family protein [Aerococcaceae bacterium zg-1578]